MSDWNDIASGFDEHNEYDLRSYIEQQRWFGGKGRGIVALSLVDRVILSLSRSVMLALIEVRDSAGSTDKYQMILSIIEPGDDFNFLNEITRIDGQVVLDGTSDPVLAELIRASGSEGTTIAGDTGEIRLRSIRQIQHLSGNVQLLGGEQSNTSLSLDQHLLLKIYRRLEPGTNPELELLLFLTEHSFTNIPALAGWYSYFGPNLRASLGIAQRFIPNGTDGWTLGLNELHTSPDTFIARMSRLGDVVGRMHCVLASEHDDPAFAPEVPSDEASAIIGARLEERVQELSSLIPDGRSAELLTLTHSLTQHPIPGQLIRLHGDLHLGQVLWTGDDWLVIDFEGEPARSLAERRQKLHPLRDVAGMLRSFSYLAAASQIEKSQAPPDGWEQRASDEFLSAYRASVAPAGLLPADLDVQERLLCLFGLEKMLYELDYEIHHRPDWVPVPLAGIERLLASQAEGTND